MEKIDVSYFTIFEIIVNLYIYINVNWTHVLTWYKKRKREKILKKFIISYYRLRSDIIDGKRIDWNSTYFAIFVDAKKLGNLYSSFFLFCDISIEHVNWQSQESAFTPQSSACVSLPGYSPLACRTALLIFLGHLFSSHSLLGHNLPRVLLALQKPYYLDQQTYVL